MKIPTKFIYYTDPGHGWIKVPMSELVRLNISNDITPFSYVRGQYVFLEEDCDASTFLNAREREGNRVTLERKHSNSNSKVRSYDRYVIGWTFVTA
jgi:hypothetical protein